MYIDLLYLKDIRTFVDEWLAFIGPDYPFRARKEPDGAGRPVLPRPRLPNVNLLLGDCVAGKSTVLRAIAMAALGPSFEDAKLPTQGLIRRERPRRARSGATDDPAIVEAWLVLHDEDGTPVHCAEHLQVN